MSCPAVGVGVNVRVSLEVGGQPATGTEFRVSFIPPSVSDVTGSGQSFGIGPTTGNSVVTITGTNFGASPYCVALHVNP